MTAVEITVPLEHLPGVTDSGTRRLLKHAAFEAPWTCGSAEGETFARLASIDLAVEVAAGPTSCAAKPSRASCSPRWLEGPLVIKLPNGRSVYGAEIEAREGVLEVQRDEAWQERLRYIDEKNAELREHMRFVNHALLNAWRVGVPVGTRGRAARAHGRPRGAHHQDVQHGMADRRRYAPGPRRGQGRRLECRVPPAARRWRRGAARGAVRGAHRM